MNDQVLLDRQPFSWGAIALPSLFLALVFAPPAPAQSSLPNLRPLGPGVTPNPQDSEFPDPDFTNPAPSPEETLQQNQLLPVVPAEERNDVLDADTITVRQFEVLGSTVFTPAELDAVLTSFLNRPLSQVELISAATAITDLYIKNNYVTSGAVIPEHKFENGIVKIQVIEGLLAEVEILGTQRLDQAYIRDRIFQGTGKPINKKTLLETLQLLRLDPLLASITAELSSGTRIGTSFLRVEVEEARAVSLDLGLNNNRSPSVGSWQRQVQFQHLNLSGKGDRFNVAYGNTNGSNSLDLGYSYPLNPRNGRLDLNVSLTRSNVIEEPFDILAINADASAWELSYRQPLVETPSREIALGASLSRRQTQARFIEELNAPFPSPGSDDQGKTVIHELRFFQDYTKRSEQDFWALRSQVSAGLPFLGASNQAGDEPDSQFFLWRGQAQYGRAIAPEATFLARSSLQLASRPLVPLAQFGVGGTNTVRGYRQDVLLGDSGWFASAELRWPLLKSGQRQASRLQIVPFLDVGGAFNRGDRPNPDPSFIASTGLGLLFESGGDRRFSGRIDYGIPLIDVKGEGDSLQARGLNVSFRYRLF